MTQNELKVKLALTMNLVLQTKNLVVELGKELERMAPDEEMESYAWQLIHETQAGRHTDVTAFIQILKENHFLDHMKEGELIPAPVISINKNFISDIEVSLPLEDGGRLTAYTNLSDSGTYQTGTMYYDQDDFPIDLSLAEIKRGELAEAHGMSKDNRDIDTYLWTDLQGNLAMQNRFSHEDIVAALESEQETERG